METQPEPKWLLKARKNRKITQAHQEIELLKLEIEKVYGEIRESYETMSKELTKIQLKKEELQQISMEIYNYILKVDKTLEALGGGDAQD